MNKILSPFPYFGGKSRMSGMIASMLDYDSTDFYIEPYGGACRVLLNKPYHAEEIYNEAGHGLHTFFNVMTSYVKTEQLINRLLENPPSRGQFEELVLQRVRMEDGTMEYPNKMLKALASKSYAGHKIDVFRDLTKAVREEDYKKIVENLDIVCNASYIKSRIEPNEIIQYETLFDEYNMFYNIVRKEYSQVKLDEWGQDFDEEWESLMGELPGKKDPMKKYYDKYKKDYINGSVKDNVREYLKDDINSNDLGSGLSDVDMAFVIFQLYYSSRDGMATAWSDFKNKSEKTYIKAVGNLRNVSERMQDVTVMNQDALMLLRLPFYKQHNVMLYLDPSYLQPEDEQKNLGEVYKMSYSYMEHEALLQAITAPDMNAKIVISNYDVELYNRYLCDWDKIYFETYTGVGSKKGNRRVEVLWKNF